MSPSCSARLIMFSAMRSLTLRCVTVVESGPLAQRSCCHVEVVRSIAGMLTPVTVREHLLQGSMLSSLQAILAKHLSFTRFRYTCSKRSLRAAFVHMP